MLRITGGICTGIKHLETNSGCQDYIYSSKDYYKEKQIVPSSDAVQVVALCDGVTHAKHAEEGAKIVSREITECLIKHFSLYYKLFHQKQCSFYLQQTMQTCQEDFSGLIIGTLQNYANQNKYALADLNCTLLAVAVKGDEYMVLHFADGFITAIDDSDQMKIISEPEKSKGYVPNITDQNNERYWRIKWGNMRQDKLRGFILFSDGMIPFFYVPDQNRLTHALKTVYKACIDNNYREEQWNNFLLGKQQEYSDKATDDLSFITLLQVPDPVPEKNAVSSAPKPAVDNSKPVADDSDQVVNEPKTVSDDSKQENVESQKTGEEKEMHAATLPDSSAPQVDVTPSEQKEMAQSDAEKEENAAASQQSASEQAEAGEIKTQVAENPNAETNDRALQEEPLFASDTDGKMEIASTNAPVSAEGGKEEKNFGTKILKEL